MLSVLIAAILGACDMSHTRCEDTELRQERSPDGKYTAVMYHRSCANNTGQYTWVNLIEERDRSFSKSETRPVLSLRGFYDITAVWTDSETVEIACEGLTAQNAILTQENTWRTIHIRYKSAK